MVPHFVLRGPGKQSEGGKGILDNPRNNNQHRKLTIRLPAQKKKPQLYNEVTSADQSMDINIQVGDACTACRTRRQMLYPLAL